MSRGSIELVVDRHASLKFDESVVVTCKHCKEEGLGYLFAVLVGKWHYIVS